MLCQHWGWHWDRKLLKNTFALHWDFHFVTVYHTNVRNCSRVFRMYFSLLWCRSFIFRVLLNYCLFFFSLLFCLRWGWHECCNHVDSRRFWEGLRKKTFAQCSETFGEYHLFFSSLPILLTHDLRAGYQKLILLWHLPNCLYTIRYQKNVLSFDTKFDIQFGLPDFLNKNWFRKFCIKATVYVFLFLCDKKNPLTTADKRCLVLVYYAL